MFRGNRIFRTARSAWWVETPTGLQRVDSFAEAFALAVGVGHG